MKLAFALLPDAFAVARLSPDSPLPPWGSRGTFFSITRTAEELSILCEESSVPADCTASRGWRCLALRGPFAFTEIGIAAAFTAVLAAAGVSVLVLSTYDTDAVLVGSGDLAAAIGALRAAGHTVSD